MTRRNLGSEIGAINGVGMTSHEVVADPVLDPRARIAGAEEAFVVGFVFGEQQFVFVDGVEREGADLGMAGVDGRRTHRALAKLEFGAHGAGLPRPVVAKPQRRQQVQGVRGGGTIGRTDAYEDVFGLTLGVFDGEVEIFVAIEYAGIEQLVFGVCARPATVLFDEVGVRKGVMRILVEHLHVRVRRHVIEVEIVFLDVLAVIAFVSGEPEKPLLDYRIFAVPYRQRETQMLVDVGDAGDSVFAPTIRARSCVVVREILPRGAVATVVFANRSPLTLAKIRSEPAPWSVGMRADFEQPLAFGIGFQRSLLFSRR